MAAMEDFSGWNAPERADMRRTIIRVLDRIANAAQVGLDVHYRESRGDGFLDLINPTIPLAGLLRALLTVVPEELESTNRGFPRANWARIRLVLATGMVAIDAGGCIGPDLADTSRLLDSQVLREALSERASSYALCVSERVYRATVFHEHRDFPATEFRKIVVHTKRGPQQAWLHHPAPLS
ncbi:hypothetical protein ACJBCE_36605 [Streptomyces sp. NBUL23]|uniref:hypothetical protein n=1 Tax=Streptomyces sp. NBUL23 TaxID=3381354 RepID=UPI003872A5A0